MAKRTVKVETESLGRARLMAGFVTPDQRARFGKGTTAEAIVLSLAVKHGLALLEEQYLQEAGGALVMETRRETRLRLFSSVRDAVAFLLASPAAPVDDLWRLLPAEGEGVLKVLRRGGLLVTVRFFDRVVIGARPHESFPLPPIGATVDSNDMRGWLRTWYATPVLEESVSEDVDCSGSS